MAAASCLLYLLVAHTSALTSAMHFGIREHAGANHSVDSPHATAMPRAYNPPFWDDVLHFVDFEGVVSDAKGNGVISDWKNTCDAMGEFVEGVDGSGSMAYHFSGSSPWSGCVWEFTPNSATSATEWTVSYWFKFDEDFNSASPIWHSLYGSDMTFSCYTCYAIHRNWDTHDFKIAFHGPGGPSLDTFEGGKWYNLLMTQRPSSSQLYIDGDLVGTASTAASTNSGKPMRIVMYPAGALDNLVFYNRSFSASEVQALLSPPTPSPTAAPTATPPTLYPTAAPTLSPIIPDMSASGGGSGTGIQATGDPHLQNIHGQKFDLVYPGKHILLHIPRSADAEDTLLHVEGIVQRLGSQCADMYFRQLNVTGRWATAKRSGGFQFRAGEASVEADVKWISVGKMAVKVVHGHTSQGISYLNFYVKHLGNAGYVVGGLLGEDDHTKAATPDSKCDFKLSL